MGLHVFIFNDAIHSSQFTVHSPRGPLGQTHNRRSRGNHSRQAQSHRVHKDKTRRVLQAEPVSEESRQPVECLLFCPMRCFSVFRVSCFGPSGRPPVFPYFRIWGMPQASCSSVFLPRASRLVPNFPCSFRYTLAANSALFRLQRLHGVMANLRFHIFYPNRPRRTRLAAKREVFVLYTKPVSPLPRPLNISCSSRHRRHRLRRLRQSLHTIDSLALTQISINSFWKFASLGRCGNCGNSGNLRVWRGVESGTTGNLALKMPNFQSSGNLR